MITIDCTFDLFYADLFTDKIGNDIMKKYFIFICKTSFLQEYMNPLEMHKAEYLRSEWFVFIGQ